MGKLLRVAGRVVCGVLVVAAALWILACVLAFVDEPKTGDNVVGFTVLIALSLLVAAGGVYGFRRLGQAPRPPRLPEPVRTEGPEWDRMRAGQPVVLHPSRLRWALLLLVAVLLTIGSAAMLAGGLFLFGAVGVLLFGAGIVGAVLQLIPGRTYLRIARDGLEIRGPFQRSHWAWNDVENFTAYEIHHQYGSTKHVGFDRRELTPAKQTFWQTLSRGMSGVDVGLPDTYGMNHEELAALLDEARMRYATAHAPSPSALADMALYEESARVPRDRVPAVTVLLALACLGLFVLEVTRYGAFPSAAELTDAGAASRDALADGRWWTLLTANVLHAHPLHILLNLVALCVLGVLLEREVGWPRFALLCLLAGLGSMALAIAIQDAVVVGVSGVVFAVAAWALLRDLHRTRGLGIVAWAVLPVGLVATFLVPGMSIGGHLGGLAVGFAFGYALERSARARPAVTA